MRSAPRSFIPILALVAVAPMLGQTSAMDVLVILKNQPQREILDQAQLSWFSSRPAQPQRKSQSDLLGLRQIFAGAVQSAVGIEQAQMYGRLTSLGASQIVHHSVINALSANVPASAVNALKADAAVANVVPQTALDLFKLLDQTVTSTANTSISAGLTSRMCDALSQVVDDVVDRYHLTLVLRGPPGSGENAITVAPAATLDDREKPDFIIPDGSPQQVFDAVGVLESAGVLDPLAKKVLLVNSADSNGWNPSTGWGKIDPAAVAGVVTSTDGDAVCTDQDQASISRAASACFTGSVADAQVYSTNSSSPSKISLTWNRHIADDGTAAQNKLELHVLDKATGSEIATSASDASNVQQVTASASSGLIVKVLVNGPLQGGISAEKVALASSTPLSTFGCVATIVTVSPTSLHFSATGGTQNVTVASPANCQWYLRPWVFGTVVFVGFDPTVHTGPGTLALTAIPNTSGSSRAGTLQLYAYDAGGTPQVAGEVGVSQDGSTQNCAFNATASGSLQFGFTGGSGTINVTANPSTCAFSVLSDSPSWLTLNQSTGGARNYSVLSNTQLNGSTQSRTGTLTVNGSDSSGKTVFTQPFGVQEAGLTCSYTLNPPVLSLPPEGIPQSAAAKIAVTTSASACQWTASSSSTSVHLIQSGSSPNTGGGSVLFWVDANNTSADRTDKIQIGDQSAIGVQGYIKGPQTFDADGTVTFPPQEVFVDVDMQYFTVELRTYPEGTGLITAKVQLDKGKPQKGKPQEGKWKATGLIVGRTYTAKIVITLPNAKNYDTLPLSIDDVTVANATNLNFRILKKPHGLFIRQNPITSASKEYQIIIDGLSRVDPNLGIYAKLILDGLIISPYGHEFDTLQDLINLVAFTALHIRADRDLGKQLDKFNPTATCPKPCEYWVSDGDKGIKSKGPASQAILNIYDPSMKGAFSFECATAQLTADYKARLDYLGTRKFNAAFPEIDLSSKKWPGPNSEQSKQWDPVAGDVVAFNNPNDTARTNENTSFLGGDLYYGHGLKTVPDPLNPGVFTEPQMLKALDPDGTLGITLNRESERQWVVPAAQYTLPKN